MARKEGFIKILDEFADRTTMHGIGSLASAHSIKSKVLWSCICLGSMGMFLYMLSRIVDQYLSYPVIVKMEEVKYKGTKSITIPSLSTIVIAIVCTKKYTLENRLITQTLGRLR